MVARFQRRGFGDDGSEFAYYYERRYSLEMGPDNARRTSHDQCQDITPRNTILKPLHYYEHSCCIFPSH